MPLGTWHVNPDNCWNGANPTVDAVLAREEARETLAKVKVPSRLLQPTAVPPPDAIWIPQLYRQHRSVATVARISGLSAAQVKRILAEKNVRLHRKHKRVKGKKSE